ncbi:MAG TPA: alpha/beta family hydrolase [Polyangiaceae bacterium]|nr:alpha/beta family hydrolase [Polyangiaceae bacterium]
MPRANSSKLILLFAPGAGASSASSWMQAWSARLSRIAFVSSFDYEYMRSGRRRPDPLPRLIETHRQAFHAIRQAQSGPIALAGKSMGSRIGCHVALSEKVEALVCFGYPLRAAGSGKLRDQVLLELTTPILFVQGTRDPLCPLPLLEAVRRNMSCRNELYVVEDGDHSLNATQRSLSSRATTQAEVDEQILRSVRGFLAYQEDAAQPSGPG